jgi:hypothetical protein
MHDIYVQRFKLMKNEFHIIFITKSLDAKFVMILVLKPWHYVYY